MSHTEAEIRREDVLTRDAYRIDAELARNEREKSASDRRKSGRSRATKDSKRVLLLDTTLTKSTSLAFQVPRHGPSQLRASLLVRGKSCTRLGLECVCDSV